MKRWSYFFLGLTLVYLGKTSQTLAHGANIDYKITQAVQIKAVYDSGQPMTNAQVVVYAPDNPSQPWLKGTTDEHGYFTFSPDFRQKGNWDVKVRQAGHGDIISIPLMSDSNTSLDLKSSNSAYTPFQKAIMAITGVWGFVGTSLFFSRNKAHL